MPNNPIDIELKPLIQKQEDYQDLKDNSILESLLKELLIDYHLNSFSYRILTLRIAYTLYEYILIIREAFLKMSATSSSFLARMTMRGSNR